MTTQNLLLLKEPITATRGVKQSWLSMNGTCSPPLVMLRGFLNSPEILLQFPAAHSKCNLLALLKKSKDREPDLWEDNIAIKS